MLYRVSYAVVETVYFLFVLASFAFIGVMPWILFGN